MIYICVESVDVCRYVWIPSKDLDPLDLELKMVVSRLLWMLETGLRSFERTLLTARSSLQPP